jgi:hypothetical protein
MGHLSVAHLKHKISGGLTAAFLFIDLVAPTVARGLDENSLDRHGYYTNSSRHRVHQPAKSLNGAVPSGASARCADGDYSFSEHHSGTCSGHGGVTEWLH